MPYRYLHRAAYAAIALITLLIVGLMVTFAPPASAQVPKNITMTVGVCDPVWPQRCAKPDVNGALPVTASISGTGASNLTQVNGQAVNVGTGAAGTGTQRVTTSTDSTIATITNPVGLKGVNGSGIATVVNPVPVAKNPYPQGSVPYVGGAAGANSAAVLTPPAVVGQTFFLTGVTLSAGGCTAASSVTASIYIAATTQSMEFIFGCALLGTATQLTIPFDPPISTTTTNNILQITLPALGAGNTLARVAASGFYQ